MKMSNKESYVLTDEYIEVINQIKELYTLKKNKKTDFKSVYDIFQEELKNIDMQAKDLEARIELLKNSE
jgi:hypothetical protein